MFDLSDESIIKRFWNLVNIKKENECWIWISGKTDGYGIFTCKGKSYRANIVAFAINIGIWPNNVVIIRHTCNNRACCNPKHLIDGTHSENTYDAFKAGTRQGGRNKGERHSETVLTEEDIRRIRYLGMFFGATEISRMPEFKGKIKIKGIWAILHNKNWRHIP